MKIKIKEIVLGTHYWMKCPFEEVSFLQDEHHHDFHITVQCEVTDVDREIEFIMLRIWLKRFIRDRFDVDNEIVRFGEKSCEMISKDIKLGLTMKYGNKNWKVAVSEDNVCAGGEW